MTPIITTMAAAPSGRSRRVKLPASIGGSAVTPEWEVLRNFNSGTLGASANGTVDGFSGNASRSLYTTEQVFEGSQACKVQMLVADGTGFGEYGGTISLPSAAFAGDVLWLDVMVYFGDGVDLTAMRNDSKFLRFATAPAAGGNAGYIDLYLSSEGARGATMFSAIKEGVLTQGPSGNGWFPMGLWTNLTKNVWHRVSLCCGLGATAVSSGGTGFLKVWLNGQSLLNSNEFRSLTDSTDKSTALYLATQWNNGVAVDQSWYVDRIRMAKNGTPSWALDLEGVSTVTPFFTDGFEGGQVNPANGVTYANDQGSPVRCVVSTANPQSGSYGLQATYNIPASLGGSSRTQLNMSLGRHLQEVWIEYYLYVPANFTPTPNQMKQVRLYGGTYNDLNKVGASTFAIGGEQRMRYMYTWQGYSTSLVGAGPASEPNAQSPTSVFGAPIDRGRFVRHRWHFKMVSALNAADAEFHYWVDNALAISYTNIPARYDPTKPYWDQLYILGSADAPDGSSFPFGNQEVICTLDTLRLYDTNPGWL